VISKLLTSFCAGNENFTLETANRLYVQNGYQLVQEFVEKTAKHFRAEAVNIDFGRGNEAAKAINDWVEQKTNAKIKDLIPASALNGLTRLVLINAGNFK